MNKAIIFVQENTFMAFDEAVIRRNQGYEIFFVCCDNTSCICNMNASGVKCKCILCTHMAHKFVAELCKKDGGYHAVNLSQLVTSTIAQEAASIHLQYNTVEELKNLIFHGVEIGYGAFSTFVTKTRNITPEFTELERDYLDTMMRNEIKMTLALERYFDAINPDLLVFHNGRFNNFKPWLCLAQERGIEYIATETRTAPDGTMMKNNFHNDIPHSQSAYTKKAEIAWKNCGVEKGTEIGKRFFDNRRGAIEAGDKVYTKDQIKGKLPKDIDSNKRNIAIFNSSEDEYFSISKEFDNAVLYPNQYIALKRLFEHYKNQKDIHFYLRIHPNLAVIPFKSHMLLYELKYDNVTIIPPQSDISSYALMDVAEKVIVFNSTMGLESSYWGKPVIALNSCFYSGYDIVYEPKTEKEFFELVDEIHLPCKKKEQACYKLACMLMGYAAEPFQYYHNKIEQWHGKIYPMKKILGSPQLYQVVNLFINKISFFYGNGKKYWPLMIENVNCKKK